MNGYLCAKSQGSLISHGRTPVRLLEVRKKLFLIQVGIGGHHGDKRKLYGVPFWDDEDWEVTSSPATSPNKLGSADRVKSASLSQTSLYPNSRSPEAQPAPSGMRTKANNLHFGQARLKAHDMILFSTDGLGDAIDPIQIFASPIQAQAFCDLLNVPFIKENKTLATTLASILDLPSPIFSDSGNEGREVPTRESNAMENWRSFIKSDPETAALKISTLKQIVLNIILKSNLEQIDLSDSGQIQATSGGHERKPRLTPGLVVQRANNHASYITHGRRNVYQCYPDFYNLQTPSQEEIFEKEINEWVLEHKLPSAEALLTQTLIDRTKFLEQKYLNLFTVPFAKMDHIAIQVIQADAI